MKSSIKLKSALVLAMVCLAATSGLAVTYTGNLDYTQPWPAGPSDGLIVGPSDLQWATYDVSIAWVVTNEDNSQAGFPWKYTYTFGHNGPQAGISHVVVEASPSFSLNNIAGLTGATLDTSTPVGVQKVAAGNPDMPEDVYGLRFDPLTTSPMGMTWTFWSNRAPVWGDFFARCGGRLGGINYAYNKGFGNPDSNALTMDELDPMALASNGSVDFHILRPDTASTVPEPSSILALMGGLATLGLKIRRKHS